MKGIYMKHLVTVTLNLVLVAVTLVALHTVGKYVFITRTTVQNVLR